MKFTSRTLCHRDQEYPQTWPITISEKTWQKLKPEHQQLLVRAANEAGTFYAKTTLERAQGDIDFMKSANKAEFITVDTAQFRKKLEPFYQSLVQDKLITQEIYDAVKALNQ